MRVPPNRRVSRVRSRATNARLRLAHTILRVVRLRQAEVHLDEQTRRWIVVAVEHVPQNVERMHAIAVDWSSLARVAQDAHEILFARVPRDEQARHAGALEHG